MRKDNRTPAYSPVSDRRRLTALVEVHWARIEQASMPQFSGPDLQEVDREPHYLRSDGSIRLRRVGHQCLETVPVVNLFEKPAEDR
jgi:hypothetical protein